MPCSARHSISAWTDSRLAVDQDAVAVEDDEIESIAAGQPRSAQPVILSHSRWNAGRLVRKPCQSSGKSSLMSLIGSPPGGGGTSGAIE